MAVQVKFSKKAGQDFNDIMEYIDENFGTTAALRFRDLVFEFTSIIQYFPEIGGSVDLKKQIRAHVIHRRLKVFYQIKKNQLVILRLFDTRQNPKRV